MQEEAAALRARSEAAGKPPLHIGIAVHTGPAVVGNNGSETNFLYTVIGDTVNLTARLQGLAVKDDVITTVETADRIPGIAELYRIERLDPVMVKGKSEPIPILRVEGRA
jgi:adenylate cyclase